MTVWSELWATSKLISRPDKGKPFWFKTVWGFLFDGKLSLVKAYSTTKNHRVSDQPRIAFECHVLFFGLYSIIDAGDLRMPLFEVLKYLGSRSRTRRWLIYRKIHVFPSSLELLTNRAEHVEAPNHKDISLRDWDLHLCYKV